MSPLLALPATVEIAGVELGTIGVIVLIIVLIGGALATLWAVGVALFWFGSDQPSQHGSHPH